LSKHPPIPPYIPPTPPPGGVSPLPIWVFWVVKGGIILSALCMGKKNFYGKFVKKILEKFLGKNPPI